MPGSSARRALIAASLTAAAVTACSADTAADDPATQVVVAGPTSSEQPGTPTPAAAIPAPTATARPIEPAPVTATPSACGVDLGDPAIPAAARSLDTEPITGRPFSTDPVGGNYDPCAALSTALVVVEGATGSSPVQALLFHRGEYVGTGTSRAYGFTTLNAQRSTGDTVVLDYVLPGSCNACDDGTTTSVRYFWDGDQVVMLDPPPPTP